MTARESDPFHDDDITQEEFEAAVTMNFPQITIEDPAAVGAWLDQQQPDVSGSPQRPTYGISGWAVVYWTGETHIVPTGFTPEGLLANLRSKLTEHDPLAKLHKDAAALGFGLVANAEVRHGAKDAVLD